jgi:hypothetical protein
MREIKSVAFDSSEYNDTNFLYSNKLIDTPTISANLTYLYGRDEQMFPLTFMSEGQGLYTSTKPIKLNDSQYTWDVMGRMKWTSPVKRLYNSALTKPGLGFQPFQVVMADNWFIGKYGAVSPDHSHQVRIEGEPQRVGVNEFLYTFRIVGSDATEYVSLDNFVEGAFWSMAAPAVPLSKSDGNRSNRMTPGKLTNQFGLYRYSDLIAGNIANKVTNIQFDGGSLWMPEQMRQFEINRRVMNENEGWYSEYNRDEFGRITTLDEDTGEEVPKAAGIKQIIQEAGNYSTYTTLSLELIDSIVNRLFVNRVDGGKDNIIMYGGQGAIREWNNAIMNKAIGKNYYEKLGQEEIKNISGGLQFGNYFVSYKDINGRIITIAHNKFFDFGPRAEQDRSNGRMVNQLPIESYNMVFLDHGTNSNGDRNIIQVKEQGREYIVGVYEGMSPLPAVWKAASSIHKATRKDIATYEVMESNSYCMLNDTTSFWLEKSYPYSETLVAGK